jgi:hypothetical protein
MGNISLLLVLIACVLTIHTSLGASFCNNVKYITIDDPRRSTVYNSSKSLCDKDIIHDDGWYRFSSEAGGEIATTKPMVESCGTLSPIWMNGSHPTVQEGTVTRKACVNVPHQYPFGCGSSYSIKVRNCSGYYIYQLKKPASCNKAYCAGTLL